MPVLLKATLDRCGGSRATLPSQASLAFEHRKSATVLTDAGNASSSRHHLHASDRQSTIASVSTSRSLNLPTNDTYSTINNKLSDDNAQQQHQQRSFLQNVKRIYKRYHFNYLLPLLFVMLYMLFGAIIFLLLEKADNDKAKQAEYSTYVHQRGLLVKRLEEILTDLAAERPGRRQLFIEEAVDYFHKQIGFSVSNESDWSLVTALYYSGTLFTTIG
uniref:Ion_trans_2 domain-containing protein n=1 Tax=Syphacia muris TaxID=451379 RepID=A0A0N5A9C7_9BILA